MGYIENFVKNENLEFRYVKGNTQIYNEMQFHPYVELYFFIGGNAEYVSDHTRQFLSHCQLVIIPQGKYHYFSVPKDSVSDYERCVINVFPGFSCYAQLADAIKDKEILSFSQTDRIAEHFNYLINSYTTFSSEDFEVVLEAVVRDIVYLIKYEKPSKETEVVQGGSLAVELVDYINEHYTEAISLKDISEKFNYSASYLLHIFKKKYGIGIKNYVLQKRLNAVRLDILQGAKIQESSRKHGFGDYPSFYRLYKKTFGCSPSDNEKQ